MDPLVLSSLIEATDDLLLGVSAAADRKMFLKAVLKHFEKNYTVDLEDYTDDEKECILINSVNLCNARKIHKASKITEQVRSAAGDLCLGIAWNIVENDLGLFGLQKYTRAIGTMFGWNDELTTPLCKQIVADGYLDTLRDLSSGKQVEKPKFNSLKRVMKRIIDLYT